MNQDKNEGLEVSRGTLPVEQTRRRLLVAGMSATPVVLSLSSTSALASNMCQPPSRVMSGNMSAVDEHRYSCYGRKPDDYKLCGYDGTPKYWPISNKPCVQKWDGYKWVGYSGHVGDGHYNCQRDNFNYRTILDGYKRKPPTSAKRVKRNNETWGSGDSAFCFGAKMIDCFPEVVGSTRCFDPVKSDYQTDPAESTHSLSVMEVLCFRGDLDDDTWEFAQECITAYFNCLDPFYGRSLPIDVGTVQEIFRGGLDGAYRPLGPGGPSWDMDDCLNYLREVRGA